VTENAMSKGQGTYPGQRLGLPATGRGSVASWGSRITALVVDWAASTIVATLLFGVGVLTGDGWRSWMTMAVFFVESALLTALAGGSAGQLATKITVVRVDGHPLGLFRAICRAAMVCMVVPAVVIGADRRGLHDTLADSVVLNRR
jgi:uncharacterized RDD family membrane protein YckC